MEGTMKCVVKTEPSRDNLHLWEKPIPKPGRGEVLIKVRLAAICGTDVHIKDWEPFAAERLNPPVTIGHEFCGEIVEIGKDVDPARVGQLVSAESHVVCGHCALCKAGLANVCLNTTCIGLHFDGAFAEYVVIPDENAITCNPDIPDEVNALLEPLGVAVHAASKVELAGKTVAIVGCGPIGLMAVAVAKKMGASKVIAVETNEYRAATALKMGADVTVNPLKENTTESMRNATDGLGPEIILEFSGSKPAIIEETKYIRKGGSIVVVGLPPGEISLNFENIFYSGVNMYGISGRELYRTWNIMKGLLDAGMDIKECISDVLPLEDFEKGFDLIKSGKALKVLLRP
ncbi:L-threonine 3-dehydrogenase [Cytobacillus pseudoceanisediminis]|uniref:L-threonine 3-dehydrogenase n=1 Tax=Cytobacillus pseudoceanisediminis TaxID=3051614 RepID=UPI003C2E3811